MTCRTTIGSSQPQRGATITETLNRRIAIGARRRHKPWFPLAVGMTLLVIGALAWLVIAGPPPAALAMTHTADDRWLIDDAPRGGVAWRAGIRPGMEVLGVSPEGALPDGDWSALLVSDGVVQITVQRKELPPGPEPLLVSIAGLVMAIGLSRFLRGGAWWFLVVALLVASFTAAAAVDPGPAIALAVVGPVAGALFVADTLAPPMLRRLAAAVVAGGAVALLGVTALDIGDPDMAIRVATALTVVLAAVASASIIRSATARVRTRSVGAGLGFLATARLVADELVPGRSRTRLSAIERERARLATELHADVLPDLTTVIRAIEAGAPPAQAAARLRSIAGELRELMGERRLSVLESLGLVPALEDLVDQVESTTGIRVDLEVDGAPDDAEARPPRDVEVAAYRICQSALDNALLHARPRIVTIRLDVEAGRIELEVQDDGVGIARDAEERAARTGRLGLVDMRDRAAGVGAALQIRSASGGGTIIALRWPA